MRNLRQCLIDYDMAMLRAIARRRGIELVSNRQREVVEQLSEELRQPQSIAAILEKLTPEEREALESLLSKGGREKLHLFVRQHGQVRAVGPGRLERERPWEEPASATEGLWYSGLVCRAFDEVFAKVGGEPRQGHTTEFIFVPQDLLPLLPRVETCPPVLVVDAAPTPEIIDEGNPALVQDACSLLGYLQKEGVRPLRDNALSRSDMDGLSKRFLVREGDGETDRTAFLHHLCQRLGLVHIAKGFLKPNPSEAKRWLKLPRAKQLLALQEAWRDDPGWNELWRVKSLRCEPTGWRNDPLLARKKILEHLSACPPGQWLSLTSLAAALKESDPDFLRPDGDYTSWYIRQAATDQYLMGFEHWGQVEGALVIHFLTKPLHWLGATSLGYGAEGNAGSFLLTSWGVTFLGLSGERPPDTSPSPMIVQPDFTIIASTESYLYDRFQLERVADWQSSGDRYVYRITRDSLARGLRQGIKVEMVVAFLERISGGMVPKNVVSALKTWDKRRGQIRLRRERVLQVATKQTMEELSTSPQTRVYLREILSPTAALVAQEDWPKLLDELRKLGYKVSGD